MNLNNNTTELQAILAQVNALPDAGGGGTQTVVVTNSNYDGFSFAYFSPNYPDWVTVAPNQTITDVVPTGAIYGVLYDNDNLNCSIIPSTTRVIDLQDGTVRYPVLEHDANRIRLFVAESGANIAISIY